MSVKRNCRIWSGLYSRIVGIVPTGPIYNRVYPDSLFLYLISWYTLAFRIDWRSPLCPSFSGTLVGLIPPIGLGQKCSGWLSSTPELGRALIWQRSHTTWEIFVRHSALPNFANLRFMHHSFSGTRYSRMSSLV
ncbi:ATP-, maltotriose- and DNA-dependent transcriptional regulator MalT [Pseudomonas syringae pv. actinidiae]|uniref:ATP-, maltotriose-and DNA-dependent transcriptional regulator MalT n=1 Tax=Pseudomonas syringae pv. actinidiae TaxID=103796 RepID=A0A2V0QN98_PSESF|nr:ATP-, maltotriose- and DNA-dependent transcriptional regulator MalT [Pseudomonas syringae pv. actinidiae]